MSIWGESVGFLLRVGGAIALWSCALRSAASSEVAIDIHPTMALLVVLHTDSWRRILLHETPTSSMKLTTSSGDILSSMLRALTSFLALLSTQRRIFLVVDQPREVISLVSHRGSWMMLMMDVGSMPPLSLATMAMMLDGVRFWMENLAVGVLTLWRHPHNFLMLMLMLETLAILPIPGRVMWVVASHPLTLEMLVRSWSRTVVFCSPVA